MRAMSIGDLNNDKMNDLVTVDNTAKKVTVYYFSESSLKYSTSASFDMPDGWTVDSVIPTSNPTQLQDLIIVGSKYTQDKLQTRFFYFEQSSTSNKSGTSRFSWEQATSSLDDIKLYPGSQPMTLDVNTDQAMDLLYQTETNGVKVALGNRNSALQYSEQDFFAKYTLSASDNSDCKTPNTSDLISLPNSNAFIDLNGDCLPDLVLTRQAGTPEEMAKDGSSVKTYYEVYQQLFVDGQAKFCLAKQDGQIVGSSDIRKGTKGSSKMPLIEFSDFNRDGMTDMAFMSETGVLNVLLN